MNTLDRFIDTFVSRRDDFALQRSDGGYVRVGRPLVGRDVCSHLAGVHTLGSYVIDEHGQCRYAVFDADSEDGLEVLHRIQDQLHVARIPSSLEQSRRGGHLWVMLATPARASLVRARLLPFCPAGVEFYPKQDEGKGYGSLMRIPLGVHRLTGKRYPFVVWEPSGVVPVATTVREALVWLEGRARTALSGSGSTTPTHVQRDMSQQKNRFPSLRLRHSLLLLAVFAPGVLHKTPLSSSGAMSRSTAEGKAVARSGGIMPTGAMPMLHSRCMHLEYLAVTRGSVIPGSKAAASLISCATTMG